MERNEIFEKLNEIFQDVFDREDITVNEYTVAADINGWDSLMHITLMQAVEDEFDIKFSMKQIVNLQNVGDMVTIIGGKL
ncbi:MAG: acyl carrier protein [Angelakisella sp.]